MASKKEIALFAAFNLGHVFKQNMQVIRMSEDSLHEEYIRHTCIQSKGFIHLTHYQTVVQDFLKYYQVDVWGCPNCGKLYWYTQEIGQVIGEQAVMLRQYKKIIEDQGYTINQIPPASFYNVIMQGNDEGMNDYYSQGYLEEPLELIQDNYEQELYQEKLQTYHELNHLQKEDETEALKKQQKEENLNKLKGFNW